MTWAGAIADGLRWPSETGYRGPVRQVGKGSVTQDRKLEPSWEDDGSCCHP